MEFNNTVISKNDLIDITKNRWEKIKNKIIENKKLEESDMEFLINEINDTTYIQNDLKTMGLYMCGGCNDLKKLSNLEIVTDINGTHRPLCKACRKKYHFETENDVIEDLKKLIKTAPEIVRYLDQYVIGQEHVKRALAVEVHNHFLKAINKNVLLAKDIEIDKNNILLTGPSGTGKTLLLKTLAKLLNIPFVIVDATNYTAAGYIGEDVQSMLSKLLVKANYNINRAKYGIIYIDEVDKIAKKITPSDTKDVSGTSVQQGLLKMVEGGTVSITLNGINNNTRKSIEMDTSNILFICGGAFDGIEGIVKERLNIKEKTKNPIGFNKIKKELEVDNKDIRKNISTKDLKKFGLIDEFLGRFSIVCNLLPLEEEQLITILKSKNGVIEQYKALFELEEKSLKFSKDSLSAIANLALKKELGARGLSSIVSTYMSDILYNISLVKKKNYTITSNNIEDYFNQEDKKEILNLI